MKFDIKSFDSLLKSTCWDKWTKQQSIDAELVPELPACTRQYSRGDYVLTLYTKSGAHDPATGVTGKYTAGDWEAYNDDGKGKSGNGIASLRKYLASHPPKSDPYSYVYELHEVRHAFKRGFIDAYVFIPNDGRVVKVTPKNFERVKKLYLDRLAHGRA